MILAQLKAYGAIAAALVLGSLLLVQTGRLHSEQLAHQKLITATTQATLKRSEAARADEIQTASKESTHAANTSKNSDEFTTSQPVRDAIARADLALADRLRTDAERRAATYRAQAAACTTASSGIADRLEALDAHIVRGAGVVAGLGADLERRDSEVKLLRKQIDTDRALMSEPSAKPGQ